MRPPVLAPAAALAAAFMVAPAAGAGARPAAPFTTPAEQCIMPAADYHRVNPYLLRAILRVESGLRPNAVMRNSNGTVDVGISQINSIHFRELGRYGIAPAHLQDACVGTYVGAWHLARVIARHGNTWEGIARYHSATPKFNRRYQALLWNELLRSGVVQGNPVPVAAQPRSVPRAAPNSGALVLFEQP